MKTTTILRLANGAAGFCRRLSWLPPLLARVSVGWIFIISGWGKLHNLAKVTEYFTSLGIPFAKLQAPFVATTEFVCGLLLLMGLAVRLASIPLICTMIVAIWTAKLSDLKSIDDLFGLSEYLYILLCTYLVVYGPGEVSLGQMQRYR